MKQNLLSGLAYAPPDAYPQKMNKFKKAIELGLSPQNIFSYACLEISRLWGVFYGSLRLRIKAGIFGVDIGRGVKAHGPVCIMRRPGGKISIGRKVSIISSWRRSTACALAWPTRLRVFGKGAVIDIGDFTELSGASITARSKTIRIGRHVMLAPNCIIVDSDFHSPWPAAKRQTAPGLENDRDVEIGDYAWIGMNCIILKGSKIGSGAIIGAGSLVNSDIPDCALAAGVPARVIKLFPPEADELHKARGK